MDGKKAWASCERCEEKMVRSEKSGRKKDGGHWLKERGMGRTE